jgi:DNA-binding response OmpR family regulator
LAGPSVAVAIGLGSVPDMSKRCMLLTSDLMLASHLGGAAERAGCAVETAASETLLFAQLAEHSADLVAIDLTTPGLDIQHIVAALRALERPPTILAFGPHVQELRLAAAADAGCDRVLTRGQFHAQMEEILREAAS